MWVAVPLVMLAVWDGAEGGRSYGVEVGTLAVHWVVVKVCGWAWVLCR